MRLPRPTARCTRSFMAAPLRARARDLAHYSRGRRGAGRQQAKCDRARSREPRSPSIPVTAASVFFDPKTKYIWALALDREGRLYVGTGDRGEMFRVDRRRQGQLFFKSDEAQIRALDFDNSGNLLAGTDGSGLIYRISPQGAGVRAVQRAQERDHGAGRRWTRATSMQPEPARSAVQLRRRRRLGSVSVGDRSAGQRRNRHHAGHAGGATRPALPLPPSLRFPTPTPPILADRKSIALRRTDRRRRYGRRMTTWSTRWPSISAGRLLAGTGNRGKIYVIGSNRLHRSGQGECQPGDCVCACT